MKDLSKAPDDKALILRWADFERALEDVEPKFGAKSQELKAYYRNGIVPYDDGFDNLMSTMERLVEQGMQIIMYTSTAVVRSSLFSQCLLVPLYNSSLIGKDTTYECSPEGTT